MHINSSENRDTFEYYAPERYRNIDDFFIFIRIYIVNCVLVLLYQHMMQHSLAWKIDELFIILECLKASFLITSGLYTMHTLFLAFIGLLESPRIKKNISQHYHMHIISCLQKIYEKNHVNSSLGTVLTPDNADLETLVIRPAQSAEKYIILFNGESESIENLDMNFFKDAINKKITVIVFDYRKTPHVLANLCTDGMAQVQRLLDQNIESRNILLVSKNAGTLGSIVAMLVSLNFRAQHIPIQWAEYVPCDFFEHNPAVSRSLSSHPPFLNFWFFENCKSITIQVIFLIQWRINLGFRTIEINPQTFSSISQIQNTSLHYQTMPTILSQHNTLSNTSISLSASEYVDQVHSHQNTRLHK